MALDQIKEERLKKIERLKSLEIDPYPAQSFRSCSISEARHSLGLKLTVVGRIRSIRLMGKIGFMDLEDESGKIQLFLSKEVLSVDQQELMKLLDIGDFIQAEGEVFKTQAGEVSVKVLKLKLLTKSIRPLPSNWYGLKDVEERLRKRYLDLILNPDVKENFRLKSKFWQSIRNYMLSQGFLEVETSVLEQTPGGADARPFVTHHYALNTDFYLRISLELPLKRLIVGGYEKVFEIGRIFRNEGIDDEHLQDYTQMEFYWAYADYSQLMDFLQDLYQTVIRETFGSLKTKWQGQEVDWSGDWPRIEYSKLLNEHWDVDIDQMNEEDLYKLAKKLNVDVEPNLGKGRLLDYIYKKTIRPKLIQPMFVINHPVEVEPLAKRLEADPTKVQRAQILAMGTELGKGFSELNDPIDQKERFEEQMKLREAGDEEAQMMDEDFVEALEYGMPPTAGFGVSERLFSMLVDKPVREMVFFPPMKPADDSKVKQDFNKKIAVIVDKNLKSWQVLNTVAHASAFIGNKMKDRFDTGDSFITKDQVVHPRNTQYPIIALSAEKDQIKDLIKIVRESDLLWIGFIKEMIDTTDDAKIIKLLAEKNEEDVEYLGIGIFGSKEEVEKITKEFKLWE